MNPFSGGIRHEMFGKPSENSPIVPIPLLCALRPVSRQERVGEHNAVVWNCVNRTPASATRRMLGISIKPPYKSHEPNPMSSHTTNKTFGAPAGACGSTNKSQSATESRTSRLALPLN